MNPKEAKKILPKKEFEAFELVLIGQTRHTSAARLKQLSVLARRLRDKYRDLARDQGADIPGRGSYEVDTSLNDRKAAIFEELMDYLEGEMEKPRPARKTQKSKATPERKNADLQRTLREARQRVKK